MAEKFISNSTVTYDVDKNGTTTVTHEITLQNTTSDFYATRYTLSLDKIEPISPTAYENGQEIPLKISKNENGTTSLEVSFTSAVVGKGEKRVFSIEFRDKTLVNKLSEIWEITTPKLADSSTFDDYSTIIKIPESFGNLAYISPQAAFKQNADGKQIYGFNKDASLSTTITAAFGNFQVFSFDLSYHLENPLNQSAVTEIALPPDTNYQKMNYTEISPKPSKIDIDQDGNWLARYELKPHEKIDVRAKGAVQLFASAQEFPKIDYQNVTNSLSATEFWQINDKSIYDLARKLKTPEAIYEYVRSSLSYNYDRVAPNVDRLGAVEALKNPKNAICTEFTDLFIALARAAGIPAREVQGYAYTENAQIQPLSLVADVLHAWPEFWDDGRQAWIPVDPTWGSTSRIDYFNKLDLRHFAFVIHGADPQKPYPAGSYKLGPSPQKDVNVTFGSLPSERKSEVKITNKILSQLPFSDEIVSAKIENLGPVAIYNGNFEVLFDGQKSSSVDVDMIAPYGYYETKINVPFSFLGQKVPSKVSLLLNGEVKSEFPTYKTYVTVSNLLFLCLFIFFIVFVIYLAFRDAKKGRQKNPNNSTNP